MSESISVFFEIFQVNLLKKKKIKDLYWHPKISGEFTGIKEVKGQIQFG